MVLYLEQTLIAFKVILAITDFSAPTFPPLLTKLCAALHQRLVSFIKCFIVGSKTTDLETPLSVSSQSEVYGDSDIKQVLKCIIKFLSNFWFNTNLSRNLI